MGEWLNGLKELWTDQDKFKQMVRGIMVAILAAALTPQGQAAIAGLAGPWGIAVPILLGLLSGAIKVGESNPKPKPS